MKVAIVQFKTEKSKQRNIQKAIGFIQKAADKKVKLILFPETFLSYVKTSEDIGKQAEVLTGPTTRLFAQKAKEYKIAILLGSVYEEKKGQKKVYNTSVLLDNRGRYVARYRKVHLFSACIDGKKIDEHKNILPGIFLATGKIEQFKFGFSVCYDLRFADMYGKYRKKGVNVFFVPSAFTRKTGKVHWETLLKARAIENCAYVLAPNQVGINGKGVALYGNSMAISPSGKILKRGSSHREEVLYVDLSLKELKKAKKVLPDFV